MPEPTGVLAMSCRPRWSDTKRGGGAFIGREVSQGLRVTEEFDSAGTLEEQVNSLRLTTPSKPYIPVSFCNFHLC